MKAIVTIILALTLAGCSVSKTVVRTSVHPETQHHIDENTVFFIQLVNTIRLNSNVTRPSTDLKNHINMLAFRAGLIPQCVGSSGCYLTKPEFEWLKNMQCARSMVLRMDVSKGRCVS